MRNMLRFLAVAILCVGIAGATGFTNGSFSCAGDSASDPMTCISSMTGAIPWNIPTGQYWQYLPQGSTDIMGWTVGVGGINWNYEYDPSNNKGMETTVSGDGGHYSIALQSNPTGSTWAQGIISQTFDTEPGVTYKLTYLYSIAPSAVAAGKTGVYATVRAEALAPQTIAYMMVDHPGYVGKSDLDWAVGYYTWTSAGTTTTIAFQSNELTEEPIGGILLDGLVFERDDVPEPGTLSMLLGAGLLGLGALIRRKRA